VSETSSSGLSDNAAGALAYMTIVPAIVFLVLPPYNKSFYVRFHSWQSIFLSIAWIAALIVLGILGRIPFLGLFIWPLILLVDLGMFILWIIVVLKAVNGKIFKLPILGALSEKQANN
jgi:uncharacterized membrane protein